MAKGNKDKITLSFTRLERFLTKIAGPKIFEFENLNKAAQAVKQPVAAKELSPPAKRQPSILKVESPRNLGVDRQKTRTS
jgi:hypothetical protein